MSNALKKVKSKKLLSMQRDTCYACNERMLCRMLTKAILFYYDYVNIFTLGAVMETISENEIRIQLKEVLGSENFLASSRMKNFFTFLVEETIAGNAQNFKADALMVDFFCLHNNNLNPRQNSLARSEIARLRHKLEQYYLNTPEAKIHMSIPKGSYYVAFETSSDLPPLHAKENEFQNSLEEYKTILVRPIIDISGTQQGKIFAEGLSNEIVLSLTMFEDLLVIDQTFVEKHSDHREFPSKYTLIGNVQNVDSHFKVWINIVDSALGHTIWSKKFEEDVQKETFFQLQEKITESVMRGIAGEYGAIKLNMLKGNYANQKFDSVVNKAITFYVKFLNSPTKETFETAVTSMGEAIEKFPEKALLHVMLSDLYGLDYQNNFDFVQNSLEKSFKLAIAAVQSTPNSQMAYQALAFNYFLRKDEEQFLENARLTMLKNPYNNTAQIALALWYGCMGLWDKAIPLMEPYVDSEFSAPHWFHAAWMFYFYMQKDYLMAFREVEKIHNFFFVKPFFMLLIYSKLGINEKAYSAMKELQRILPNVEQEINILISRFVFNKNYEEVLLADFEEAKKKL